MSVTQADIDRIVQEVVAQLKAAAQPVAPAAPPPPEQTVGVFVESRVVTLQSIAGRLNGAKQLVVAPGALVTPSVRDELRRRGIELVKRMAAKKPTSLAPVLLIAGRTGPGPELAAQMLRKEGVDLRTEKVDCLIEATAKLAAAVGERQAGTPSLGVLWTRHSAVGICLANRYACVRAVLATNVAATAAAVAAVGANLLIIDPTIGTVYEKKQVLHEFCLGGIRPCPKELKEGLEPGTQRFDNKR